MDKHYDVYKIEFVSSGSSDDDMDALFLFSCFTTEKLKVCKCQLFDPWKSAEKL